MEVSETWPAMTGYGWPWSAMSAHGQSWTTMTGHGKLDTESKRRNVKRIRQSRTLQLPLSICQALSFGSIRVDLPAWARCDQTPFLHVGSAYSFHGSWVA